MSSIQSDTVQRETAACHRHNETNTSRKNCFREMKNLIDGFLLFFFLSSAAGVIFNIAKRAGAQARHEILLGWCFR